MRPPTWTSEEDAHLIDLRNSGLTGARLRTAFQILFPARTEQAIKNHIVTLRRKKRVR